MSFTFPLFSLINFSKGTQYFSRGTYYVTYYNFVVLSSSVILRKYLLIYGKEWNYEDLDFSLFLLQANKQTKFLCTTSNHLISWVQSTNMVIVFPNQEIQVYSQLHFPYLEVSLKFSKAGKYLSFIRDIFSWLYS